MSAAETQHVDDTAVTISTPGSEPVETTLGEMKQASEGLFNPRDFDDPKLKIETEEGKHVDEIVVKVSGSFTLWRKSAAACDLFRALQLGRPCVLEVDAKVAGDGDDVKVSGGDETTTSTRKLKAGRIRRVRIAGEEHVLVEEAA